METHNYYNIYKTIFTVSKLPDQCERSDKGQAEIVYTVIRSETPVWEFLLFTCEYYVQVKR